MPYLTSKIKKSVKSSILTKLYYIKLKISSIFLV